jgi:hypothetical protein
VTDFLSGGLVFAIAAVLWIVYLIPSWLRRRNYIAAEHNTARLQQTLRVLVEAEDAPTTISAEVSARGVHDQHKALREAEAKARAALRAQEKAEAEARRDPAEVAALARHRRRTFRQIGFVALLVSLLGVAAGVALLIYTGVSALLTGSSIAVVSSFIALGVLAAKPKAPKAVAPASAPAGFVDYGHEFASSARTWTPAKLPRPLHLEPGSLAQATVASADVAARLRQAAQEEALRDRLERAAELNRGRAIIERETASVPVEPATRVASSALDEFEAREKTATTSFNLDELYRRRAVGQ